MELTQEQLVKLIPANKQPNEWFAALSSILPQYEINTAERMAAFLAQCIHESAGFTVLKENLNYSKDGLRKVFPKYFPDEATALRYARQPVAIANRVYGGRMGNGNEQSGDGFKFSGKGIIQLTGKSNVTKFAEFMKMNPDDMPAYLLTCEGAVHSACWFWTTNKLNDLADKKDIVTITKRINGGTIGLEDRKKHYAHALEILGA